MMALSAQDLADLRRWSICGAVIVLAHGTIAASVVNWHERIEPTEPAAAIVVEFAPVPVAPAAPQTEVAPGPEQVMSEASPERPIEQVEEKQKTQEKVASRPVEEPAPEIKPAPNPDVTLEPRHQELTAATVAHAGTDDVRAAGASRAEGSASGGAHAGSPHPPHFERGADVANGNPGTARAQ
jgi:periplasmic protein TonB